MPCKNCENNPVIKLPNSNIYQCKKCFNKYFEKKVRKTIRMYKLIDKKDIIGVACSGGKDSMTTLYLLGKILKSRNQKIIAITIDEGIDGYRDLTFLKNYCKENNIDLHSFSYKEEFGKTLDTMLKLTKEKPCSICGVFRRYILNTKAKKLGVTKLATGHNLDDEAQTVLMNQFRRNVAASLKLGPITGVIKDERFIRRIKPLYFMTEREVATFAFINNLKDDYKECPNNEESYRCYIRDKLNEIEEKFPGTKHSIITSFLETLPLLRKNYNIKKIKTCKSCSEPCSQEVCQACKLAEKIKLL
ncbi:TIGR00269 family protein [Candidatus Woesearchaeota archaeon]|nr:TIGR00269 family protein [Candidatus Woesearchaeota archaeon]